MAQADETFVEVDGARLCVRREGSPADPAVVLLHGAGQSLVAWPDELCRRLVAAGLQVVRTDARDAGRSTTDPVGSPTYALRDLVTDAAAVISHLDLGAAHVVGLSQGAAVAQLLALDAPHLVASLTLASSTPGGPGHDQPDLPAMSPELAATFAEEGPAPDWGDRQAVATYLVDAERPFVSPHRPFEEATIRGVAEATVARSTDVAAQVTNPFLIDPGAPWRDRLGEVSVPTLVVHGEDDPFFPLGHGEALRDAIGGARLLALARTGHEIPPAHTWDVVVPAIVELAGAAGGR